MTSWWARWRLKSPGSPLFTQPCIQAQIKKKLRVTGPCAANYRWPVNSPHKWPVTRKMFPFDDVIIFAEVSLVINDWKQRCEDLGVRHIFVNSQRDLTNFNCLNNAFYWSIAFLLIHKVCARRIWRCCPCKLQLIKLAFQLHEWNWNDKRMNQDNVNVLITPH